MRGKQASEQYCYRERDVVWTGDCFFFFFFSEGVFGMGVWVQKVPHLHVPGV